MKQVVIVISFIFLAIACDRQKDTQLNDISIKDLKSQKIELKKMDADLLLGDPVKLHLSDSLLFIVDMAKNPLVEIYDLKNKQPICQGIFSGNGPNEVLCPIDTELTKTELCVLERQTGRFKHFALDGILQGEARCNKVIQLPNISDRALFLDSTYMSCGIYDSGLMLALNNNGETTAAYSPCSDFIKEVPDKHVRYRLGQGCFAHKHGKLVFVTFFTSEIRLFDINSDSLSLSRYITVNKNDILDKICTRTKKNDYSVYKTDLKGCRDVYATDRYFYVSFSDDQAGGIKTDHGYILKFDYEGNLQASYKTDKQFTCFAVDAEDRYLYAVATTTDLEYIITRAALNADNMQEN